MPSRRGGAAAPPSATAAIDPRNALRCIGWSPSARSSPRLPCADAPLPPYQIASSAAYTGHRAGSRWGIELLHQLLQGRVDGLLARPTDPLVPDHPPGIEDVERRRVRQVPSARDRPRTGGALVRERPPGQLLLLHHVFEVLAVAPDVHADQCERLVLQTLHERPLVGPLAPSGQSVFRPEVEQHDLAPVVAELEPHAVL